MDCLHWQCF
jgi:hypothetical protein